MEVHLMEPVASLDVTNLVNDLSTISKLPPEKITQNIMQDIGQKIEIEAKALAPVRTGALRDSIKSEYTDGSLVIDAAKNYAAYQEFGTGGRGEYPGQPYTITPKSGKYLVFKVGGKTVFAKKVTHPGVPAHPFLRPATQKAVEQIASGLVEQGSLIIRKGPNSAL